jgi:hypothetical protein
MNRFNKPGSKANLHIVEQIVLDFIDALCNDQYRDTIPVIDADAELAPEDRIAVFRTLEHFVKSQKWSLWFTSFDVLNHVEDAADCYLMGTSGDVMLLLLGYHYDVGQWRIGAYEIPEYTFSRPQGESYADYMERNLAKSYLGAQPLQQGIHEDGRYFIDHREQ